MAARITRAKKKIAAARIPYRVPRDAELPERLAGVLRGRPPGLHRGPRGRSGDELVRRDLWPRRSGWPACWTG